MKMTSAYASNTLSQQLGLPSKGHPMSNITATMGLPSSTGVPRASTATNRVV